jgi:hypothetical protein
MVHKLIDAGIHESHELDLADGPQTLGSHADAKTTDQDFGQRRIKHAFGPEPVLQTERCPEHAAIGPNVLAEEYDIVVLRHGSGQSQVDGLDQS